MAAKNNRRRPAFFWQGALIMLPVAVLAVASLISIRQDEREAENDARNRAAENAQSLGRAMRASVDEELHRFLTLQNVWMIGLRLAGQPSVSGVFPDAKLQADIEKWERDYPGLRLRDLAMPQGIILADGRQIEPPEHPVVPRPPKWFSELSPAQMKLWEALCAGGSRDEIEKWRQAFLDGKPSTDAQEAVADLFQTPELMAAHSNCLPTETGISFEEIACYRLLTATNAQLTDGLLQSVWWHAIDHASFVSRRLLDLASGLTNRADPNIQRKYCWMRVYFDTQTWTADCLYSLRQLPDLQPWKMLWWSHWTKDSRVLAIFQPTNYVNPGNDADGVSLAGEGYEVWLVPRAVVAAIFKRILAENQSLIPPYASAEITAEGVALDSSNDAATVDRQSLLAETDQSAGNYFAQDAIRFQLKYFLASRSRMLASEQHRAKLFGALILAAALTALVGLLSARRAFRHQLQLNEQKSNFVSSVSHELRAPIASVRLMAENLERGKISEPAKQGEYFRFIVQECRRLSSLIENVLDFSRIEQGRKQYEFEPTNLLVLAETTVKLMEPYAAEKGVQLEFRSELRTPNFELNLDGRAIQQALVNLIDNAVKHSPKGETVTVGIGHEESWAGVPPAQRALQREQSSPDLAATAGWTGGTPVLLYVADHGPGIPAAEHEKIFERFYRLGSELRRETQGVGIGLSVVKHIVEAHGGHVRVESEPGQGSRFTIELPAKK